MKVLNLDKIANKTATIILAVLISILLYLPFMNMFMADHHHNDAMGPCITGAMSSFCPMTQLGNLFNIFGSITTHSIQTLLASVIPLAILSFASLVVYQHFTRFQLTYESLSPPRWKRALSRGLIHPKSY